MNASEQLIQAQTILCTSEVTEQQRVALIQQMIEATLAIYTGSQFSKQGNSK